MTVISADTAATKHTRPKNGEAAGEGAMPNPCNEEFPNQLLYTNETKKFKMPVIEM
jgi:hypothetical protein